MAEEKQDTKGQLLRTQEILGISEDVETPAGQVIFREGEDHDRFYIILEGKVAIRKKNSEGVEKVIAELGPGEFFGENVLLGKKKKPATAQAVERARLLAISYDHFQELIQKDATAGVNFLLMILEVVGNRLSHSNKQILALNTMNKLMQENQDDATALSRLVIEHLLALTESEEGAVFLYNPFSKTYRTAHTTVAELSEAVLEKIDPAKPRILRQEGKHWLVADLEKMGMVVLRRSDKKRAYTDEDLRLLILVAEQLSHTLENAAARAETKARERLHQKRFAL